MKLFPLIHLAVKYKTDVACVNVNCKHKAFTDNIGNSDAEFDESLNRISENFRKTLSPDTKRITKKHNTFKTVIVFV